MAQNVTVAKNIKVPARFAASVEDNDELSAGITRGFSVLGYRGKVWRIKSHGDEIDVLDGDGNPVPIIEVVLIKAAATKSKTYYPGGWEEGSNKAPTCWSSNSVLPDAGVLEPQSPSCAACPNNAIGSRITDSGKGARACGDYKRVAIVPLGDMDNEAYGGPMLLRIPGASLTGLDDYAKHLKSLGVPYFGVVTRLKFDVRESYPKIVLTETRGVTEDEADKVDELRADPRVAHILAEEAAVLFAEPEGEATVAPAQGAPAAAPQTVSQRAMPKAPVKPAPQPAASPAPPAAPPAVTTPKPAPRVAPKPATAPAAPAPTARPAAKAPTGAFGVAPAKPAPARAAPAPAPVIEAEGDEPGEADGEPLGFENELDDALENIGI
jgi:hypothetical protein